MTNRILRLACHEDLTTQTDNCLLYRTVTVVFKVLVVQGDHVFWRPENTVVEETVTVIGDLYSNFGGANRAVPYKWSNSVQWAWSGSETVQRRTYGIYRANRHHLRSINGVEERSFQWPTEYRCEYFFRTTGKPNLYFRDSSSGQFDHLTCIAPLRSLRHFWWGCWL